MVFGELDMGFEERADSGYLTSICLRTYYKLTGGRLELYLCKGRSKVDEGLGFVESFANAE